MFGKHNLLERKLRKGGTAALAMVLEVESRHTYNQSMPVGPTVSDSHVKLHLRVEPEGGEPFEAHVDAMLPGTDGASEGMVVPVLFDPADHSCLVVDTRDEAWQPAIAMNVRLRIDQLRAGKR